MYSIDADDGLWWRCMNAAWGCNWMVIATAGDVWCRSCQLTRGRPDAARPDAIDAWMTAEAAKRRLVHQIDSLGLPIDPRSLDVPDGLAFDLVHVPGEHAVTGHLDGVVTLDLAETDDLHRHRLQEQFDEQFRTVIGHLRHEIGHHYFNRLIGQSDNLVEFRRLFGDERGEYADAIAAHYASGSRSHDDDRFITRYAAAHPLEDWAETFAHYLHIVDATDTAAAHDIAIRPAAGRFDVPQFDVTQVDFAEVLAVWRPTRIAVNDVAESLGVAPVYPFDPTGVVVDKLTFVHRQVVANSERERFYAAQ